MAEDGSVIAKLLDRAREDPGCVEELEKLRRTITVMFTDIQGSTPNCRAPVPASIMMTPSLERTSRQVVLPP